MTSIFPSLSRMLTNGRFKWAIFFAFILSASFTLFWFFGRTSNVTHEDVARLESEISKNFNELRRAQKERAVIWAKQDLSIETQKMLYRAKRVDTTQMKLFNQHYLDSLDSAIR